MDLLKIGHHAHSHCHKRFKQLPVVSINRCQGMEWKFVFDAAKRVIDTYSDRWMVGRQYCESVTCVLKLHKRFLNA